MRTLLFILVLSLTSPALWAQESGDTEPDKLAHLAIYPSYEINPVLSFALVVPQNLSGDPEDSFTMSLNSLCGR